MWDIKPADYLSREDPVGGFTVCQMFEKGAGCMQVRSMRESRGDVAEAGPSIAVQMVGLNTVPIAGDEFCVCSSEQEVHPPLPITFTITRH